ncbi:serpin family protein [Phormidesmis sp. 146-33]
MSYPDEPRIPSPLGRGVVNKLGIAMLATIVTLSSISCSSVASPNLTAKNPPRTETKQPPKTKLVVNPQLVTANTRFGFKLFSEVLKQDGKKNVFVSPSSVAIALSMAYNGAGGTTQQAMAKALEVNGLSLQAVNQANSDLKQLLQQGDPKVELTIANSLWARQGVNFKPAFLESNKTFYNAEVTTLDFSSPTAPKTINSWVDRNTRGKISEIVDSIDPDQVMFLVNAIYFKGKWTTEFNKQQTSDRPFSLPNGSQKQHPTMQQKGEYRYFETEQFQAVSLPYGKGRTSLYVFLPKKGSNLTAFSKTLTAENWQTWMKKFGKREGLIELPRFKMEYEIELKKALSALGMGETFDRQANFSNLADVPVKIDEVKHKTFVEVNEEGTEAAAVTSIGIRTTSVQVDSQPFEMKVDRPFFCAIRDNKTGSILFMGSIVDPK